MVDRGEADDLMPLSAMAPRMSTARVYLDKYGPAENYDLLRLLPAVPIPALMTLGSEEGLGPDSGDWFQFGGLAGKVRSLLPSAPRLSFELIEGANHGYARREEELWAAAMTWLAKAAVATA